MKTVFINSKAFDTPLLTLKSGAKIMRGPVPSEWLTAADFKDQPPQQPACGVTWHEACDFAQLVGGRLPAEEEWMEHFFERPYFGGILEWTTTSESNMKVLRGGSWVGDAQICRAAYRDRGGPGYRALSLGFRLVWD